MRAYEPDDDTNSMIAELAAKFEALASASTAEIPQACLPALQLAGQYVCSILVTLGLNMTKPESPAFMVGEPGDPELMLARHVTEEGLRVAFCVGYEAAMMGGPSLAGGFVN